jgi:arabinogalactan oligomer/maltooligosaccharide transport system permease protein
MLFNIIFIVIPFLPIWQWDYYFDNGLGGYVELTNMTNAINYVGFTYVWIFFIIIGGIVGFILIFLKPDPDSQYSKDSYAKVQLNAIFSVVFGLIFGILMAHGILGLKNMIIAPAMWIVLVGALFIYVSLIDGKKWEKIRREALAYIFIFPTFILMIFIFYIPIFLALYTSFQDFYGLPASRFVFLTQETINLGFQNYATILFPDLSPVNLSIAGRTFNPQLDLMMFVLLLILCLITIIYGTYGSWSIKKKIIIGGIALYGFSLIVIGWNSFVTQNFDLFLYLGLIFLASLWVLFSITTAQTVSDKYKQYLMYLLTLIPIFSLYLVADIFINGYETVSALNPFYLNFLDPKPLQVVYNTIIWTFTCVIAHISLGLLLAVVLNKKFMGRTVIRSIMIVPWAVPSFISITIISYFILPSGFGAFDLIFSWFHFDAYNWYYTKNFLASAIMVNIFLGYSFTMVAFLAALQAVSPELYEAAEIDGANAWEKFRSISLPNIKPVVVVTSILGFMWTFNMFNVIWLMRRPVSSVVRPEDSYILIVYVFQTFYPPADNWSFAAAMSFILFVILIVLTKFYTKITGKGPYDLD